MGAGQAVVAASGTASAGLSSAAGAESGRDGRDSVGAADGDAVERVERDRDLLLVGGASALSGVGRSGVFHEIWRRGLLEYDSVVGIDWEWLAADGATGKAPLGGAKSGPNPTDRAKKMA